MGRTVTQSPIITKEGWIEQRGVLRAPIEDPSQMSKRELIEFARFKYKEARDIARLADAHVRHVEAEYSRQLANERKIRMIVQQHQGDAESEVQILKARCASQQYRIMQMRRQLLANGILLAVIAISLALVLVVR